MHGALAQGPEYISSPFAAARIYQGGDQPSYFPDAQQFMPQVKARDFDPAWVSTPFAPARIYQGGEQPSYFPNANQFMPQKDAEVPKEGEGGETKPPVEDISWRQVEQDSSYPTAPFARARIFSPDNGRESYWPNTLDTRS